MLASPAASAKVAPALPRRLSRLRERSRDGLSYVLTTELATHQRNARKGIFLSKAAKAADAALCIERVRKLIRALKADDGGVWDDASVALALADVITGGASTTRGTNPIETPLHKACSVDKDEGAPIVCMLLSFLPEGTNVMVDVENLYGETPLHCAAWFLDDRFATAVRALLAWGADATKVAAGTTPADRAQEQGHHHAGWVIDRHVRGAHTLTLRDKDTPAACLPPQVLRELRWSESALLCAWAGPPDVSEAEPARLLRRLPKVVVAEAFALVGVRRDVDDELAQRAATSIMIAGTGATAAPAPASGAAAAAGAASARGDVK